MEAIAVKPFLRQPAQGRGVDLAAEGARLAEARIVEHNELGERGIDRFRPLLGLPVVGGLGLHRKRPGAGPGVGHEGLGEGIADVRAIVVAGEGPDVVCQYPRRPGPAQNQAYRGRTRAPFPGPDQGIGRRGQQNDRTDAPGETAGGGLLRREEERGVDVPQAKLGAGLRKQLVLVDHRHDRPGDEAPVTAEVEGDHRLNIGGDLVAIVLGTEAAVQVHLDRDGHQIGQRIGQFLGEIGVL